MVLKHEHVVAVGGSSTGTSVWVGMNDTPSVSVFFCCSMRYEYIICFDGMLFKSVFSVPSKNRLPCVPIVQNSRLPASIEKIQ